MLDTAVRARLDDLIARAALPLPLLPEAAAQVMRIVDRPNCDARELAEVIRRDPALTTNVFRVAASPVYAGSVKLVSLQQIIGRLGFAAILQIALVVASRARVFESTACAERVRADFRHSFATALFAQEVARQKRGAVDVAFITGLLHDIGRPILLDAIVRLCGGDADLDAAAAVAEERHAEVGGMLAEQWQLPARVGEAIHLHHTPAGCELATLVAVADAFAHGRDPGELAQALNLYPEDIARIAAKRDDIAQTVASIA